MWKNPSETHVFRPWGLHSLKPTSKSSRNDRRVHPTKDTRHLNQPMNQFRRCHSWCSRNPAITSWYGNYPHYLQGFFTSQVVVWDFWTINSMLHVSCKGGWRKSTGVFFSALFNQPIHRKPSAIALVGCHSWLSRSTWQFLAGRFNVEAFGI